jgi:hypothetical protein
LLAQVGYQRRWIHSKREHSMQIILGFELRKEGSRRT